jgi:hypothetical protein
LKLKNGNKRHISYKIKKVKKALFTKRIEAYYPKSKGEGFLPSLPRC